jgi:hypothetical protein
LGSIWLYLGSFWVRFFTILNNDGHSLGSIWVRFFTIVNNDGHSLGSFFQKNIFAGQEPEFRSQKPELGGAGSIVMD